MWSSLRVLGAAPCSPSTRPVHALPPKPRLLERVRATLQHHTDLGRHDRRCDGDANGPLQISANVVNRLRTTLRVRAWMAVVVAVVLFAVPRAAEPQPL